jgi:hypothetical protein
VKIGCSETSPEQRVTEWKRSYPEAKSRFSEPFENPHRMEELIYLQMADLRFEKDCHRPVRHSTVP